MAETGRRDGPPSGRAGDRVMAGVAVRLGSTLCISSMTALVKLAQAHGASVGEAMFFRQGLSIPLVLGMAVAGPGLHVLPTRRIDAQIGRAAVGLTGMACLFAMVHLLPLAEATALQFTVPIFATVLGAAVLREQIGWRRWVAVVLGFAGVMTIARPGASDLPLAAALIGLAYGLLTAVVSILLRSIGRTEHPLATVFWFATLSMVPLLPLYVVEVRPHPPMVWLLLVGIGLAGGASQIALTASLRLAPVSAVVPVDYMNLVWTTLLGWLVFGALPDAATWLGAPLIVGSGLYIVWREHVRRQVDVDRLVD